MPGVFAAPRAVTLLAAIAALLPVTAGRFAGTALAQKAEEECSATDEAKSGLCSHALAQLAQIEAMSPKIVAGEGAPILLGATDETDVTHCLLDFEVRTTTSPKSIIGSNTLYVTSRTTGLTQMTLDLHGNLSVTDIKVNGVSTLDWTRPTNQIVINLGGTYNIGQAFTVQVYYNGSPRNRTDGWSFDFFDTQWDTSDVIAASFNEPFYAYYWYPCKEPKTYNDDKFTLQMHVTVPNPMTVASNGWLEGVDTLSGNRKKFRWREDYPIATYLVSFAATNYQKETRYYNYPGGSMPVEFYIYPSRVSESLPYLDNIVQAIATFSDWYGQYPFIEEKYGIAQFQWCCGMEHQTMTSQGYYTSETRNVHELAHQWWGDSITCKTWHDIWLNEGFARFSEALWREMKPGGSYADALSFLNSNRPSTTGTGTVYCYTITNTSTIFSTTYTYNKGGWTMHMLRNVMGDERFFNALTYYRSLYDGGAADTEEWRAACEMMYGGSLSWFFNEWVYNQGYPYYEWGWEPVRIGTQDWVKLHVKQYQRTVVSTFPRYMKMPIDLSITTDTGAHNWRIWNDATGTTSTVTEWFLIPANSPATYVQFDPDTKILRGAANQVSYSPGPPKIVALSPQGGGYLPAVPGVHAIVATFSEPVNMTAADVTITGTRSGTQTCTVSLDESGCVATLAFDRMLPNNQTWTISFKDTITSQQSSLKLDGEMSGPGDPASLPSGDGMPGGSGLLRFTLGTFAPDLDYDGDVDNADVDTFIQCMTGADQGTVATGCQPLDFDFDNDIDQSDFGTMQNCISGDGEEPDANCW